MKESTRKTAEACSHGDPKHGDQISALFIGGSMDGKRMITRLHHTFECAVSDEPWRIGQYLDPPSARTWFRTERYRLEQLRGDGTLFWVYMLEGMRLDEAMERLLTNYQPKVEPSKGILGKILRDRIEKGVREITENFEREYYK